MAGNHLERAKKYFINRYLSTRGGVLPIEECLKRSENSDSGQGDVSCGDEKPNHPFAKTLGDLFEEARNVPGQRVFWSKSEPFKD